MSTTILFHYIQQIVIKIQLENIYYFAHLKILGMRYFEGKYLLSFSVISKYVNIKKHKNIKNNTKQVKKQ